MVADRRPERLAQAERRYPGIRVTTDPLDLIADPAVDAVAIATPVALHFELASAALRAGKHVLVEKPMASTSDEASRLIDEAARRQLVLMVDHTFVYTGAVQKMRELVGSGELGDLYYYDSVRINLGLFQQDVDVLWDLAVHDLSIMDFVLSQQPVAVSATGLAHVPGRPKNIAYMTMFFDGPMIAHVQASWLAPVKVRRTLLGGSRRMIVFDDLEGEREDQGLRQRHLRRSESRRTSIRCSSGIAPATCGRRSLRCTEALDGRSDTFRRLRDARDAAAERRRSGPSGGAAARGGVGVDAAARPAGGHSGSGSRVIPYADLRSQYRSIKPEIDAAVLRVLDSTQFILGEEVVAFEREFAAYCGTTEAIGVNSGNERAAPGAAGGRGRPGR